MPPPSPPPTAAVAEEEAEETTAKPLVADVVPLADPQTTATEIATPCTAATETPSWPSQTQLRGGASAGAAAAMKTAPWGGGLHTTAASFDPPQTSYSIPQNCHQVKLEEEQQQQEVDHTPALALQAAAPYDVSSFSSYTNLLADPPLPPPLDQDRSHHHPLFDSSASIQSNGTSADVSCNDAAATADKVHHSSFLASMQLETGNTTTMDTKSTSLLSNIPNNNNNGNVDGDGKEVLPFGKTPAITTSPPHSRSARSTGPTPSSPDTTSTTNTNTAITAVDVDGVNKGRDNTSNNVNNNSNEGNNDTIVTRPKDFKELQHHIGELTEEKFTLQRCLEQQTALADRLAAENEELTVQVNASGRAVEEARHELDVRRREVAVARAQIATAMAERDAYEMGAREASERAKTLAIEVVALEEKMLKLKSEQLKMISEKEKTGERSIGPKSDIKGGAGGGEFDGGENSSSGTTSTATAVMAAEKRAELVSTQLNAANRQIEELKREKAVAEQQLATAHATEEALATEREEERKEAAAVAAAAAERQRHNHSMHIEQQQQLETHAPREDGDEARTARAERPSSAQRKGEGYHSQQPAVVIKEPLKPRPSALLAGEAMIEAETLSKSQKEEVEENEEEEEDAAVPAEIRALLPPAVWTPGAQGLDPSVNDLVERIYEVVGILESERRETAAALAAQRQTNVALRARLEALLASQELELQKSSSQVTE